MLTGDRLGMLRRSHVRQGMIGESEIGFGSIVSLRGNMMLRSGHDCPQ